MSIDIDPIHTDGRKRKKKLQFGCVLIVLYEFC